MLLHTRSLVGSIIDTREFSFRKRQAIFYYEFFRVPIIGIVVSRCAEPMSSNMTCSA